MNTLKHLESNVVEGLGTSTLTITNAGGYFFRCYSTLPQGSAMIITINKNGTPIATSALPVATARFTFIEGKTNCVPGDSITFVLSSSAAVDAMPNTIKSVIYAIGL